MAEEEKRAPAEWKTRTVAEIKEIVKGKKVVGIVSLLNLPSAQFQEIKKKVRDAAKIKVARSRLIRMALDSASKEYQVLDKYIEGPCAVIASDLDPFELYRIIKKNRTKAYAKPGMIAEDDIIVEAGDTGIPAGPALGELKAAGLNVKLDKGKIVVASDTVFVKKGEIITPEKASVLAKLDIKPMEIGLKIKALYSDGIVYEPEVLDVDTEELFNSFVQAHAQAVNLSVNAGIINKYSAEALLVKAVSEARALALEANIYSKETIEEILSKASRIALNLKSNVKTEDA